MNFLLDDAQNLLYVRDLFSNHCISCTERLGINVSAGMPHYKQNRMALERHFMLERGCRQKQSTLMK
jgi:hypothetical protein